MSNPSTYPLRTELPRSQRPWRARMLRRSSLLLVLMILLSGCGAAYTRHMKGPLKKLGQRDYEGALQQLEKADPAPDKLLYRLEKGLMLHYLGEYEASNLQFAKAERLIDKRFTRSLSRELVSLLTNDAVRKYAGEEFESVLINYYRALNYQYLGQPQEALVECRKANLKLEKYAAAAEYELTYKNDAFMQYVTGLFFEAEEEWNDAYISYRDAEKGYGAYALGTGPPQILGHDLLRSATRLGYQDHILEYLERYEWDGQFSSRPSTGEVVVFAETGFIARKRQHDISLPILKADKTHRVWALSDEMAYRYHHRRHYPNVEYWLKVALPEYHAVSSQISGVRLSAAGQTTTAVLVQDLDAIAMKNFKDKETSILARTAARALAKYIATEAAEKQSEILGFLVNLFGASTEAADTRSWLALPRQIRVARLRVRPGTVDLVLEFVNGSGRVVDGHRFAGVEVSAGQRVFLNYRSYK
jgi:hypothetical protein